MESKQNDWLEKKVQGDIAETIVKFLIESTGWKCVKYGVENHAVGLKEQLKKNNQNEISRKIRSTPDIVAVNTETKDVLLIEVKYKSFIGGFKQNKELYKFNSGQIEDYLDFWGNAHLVVVHNYAPYFYVINLKDIDRRKHLDSPPVGNQDGKPMELWNFKDIRKKDIRVILPDLPEPALQKAIVMVKALAMIHDKKD